VSLRSTPNLAFALDESFDSADRISSLLARPDVARDLEPQAGQLVDRADED
jgi:ribosome-binding factor A